ncbi:MAG: TetR/AcrR family transcriptional regulator [Desulfobacteraceae bacterium]|jgi:AcrR family transcriptional regulator
MGRKPKSQNEVDDYKTKILDTTLKLISEGGYEAFSIRKLGPTLGIAPKTVYNYFSSKDEIYLHILTRGFELLYEDIHRSVQPETDPLKKLESLARAFASFGFEKPNYYDLMFTWHVPKFNDFKGTELEPLAFRELQTAMKSFNLLRDILKEIAIRYGSIPKNDAQTYAIQLFATIHGIVALRNNTLINYLHENPDKVVDALLEGILVPLRPVE